MTFIDDIDINLTKQNIIQDLRHQNLYQDSLAELTYHFIERFVEGKIHQIIMCLSHAKSLHQMIPLY